MKKILCIIGAVLVVAGVCVLAYLKSTETSDKNELKGNDISGVISVENYLKSDKAHMDTVAPGGYKWYETCIKMTGEVNTLSEPTFEMVTNVFQVNTEIDGGGFSTTVYGGKHLGGKSWWDTTAGFWVEDNDMMEYSDSIISFEDAFKRLQEANCPKPKSVYCTLRKQIGPHPSNPQWIFGNDNRGTVYVDAITGDVSTKNPVFPLKGTSMEGDSITNFIFK